MYQINSLIALGSILTCFLIHAQAADKYTDENRPYEFGFTIDGEQHRHEKKDKNGIIMGEFGFITADGVYHVTVYATDKQGRFQVLSMKNIRVKPYPAWHPKTSERQGHSLSLPPSQVSPVSQAQAVSNQPPENQFKQVSIEPPANSCSHCSLPTTTTRAPKIAIPSYNQQNNNNPLYSSAALENTNFQNVQPAKSLSSFPSSQNTPNLQTSGFSQNNPQRKPTDISSSQFQHELNSPQQKVNAPQNYPQQVSGTAQNYPQEQQNNPQPSTQQVHGNPQQDNEAPQIYLNEKQNDLYNPQQGANTDQTYPQQHSKEPQYYSAGQQNSLNGPQILFQPGSITSHQETNTEHTHPQQVSAPAQINPSEQQNSLNSPQIFQQALDNPQRAYSQEDSGLAHNYPTGQQNSLNIPQTSSYQGFGTSQNSPRQQSSIEQSYPLQDHAGGPKEQGGVVPLFPEQVQNPNLQTQHGSATGERTPKVLNDYSEQPFDLQKGFSLGKQPLSKRPTLFAAQMQIVDKNTDIYHIGPGEKEGLPEGLQKDEITQLLYTFNYTLAFQGHFEEGYTNGVKQGYYFVTGRNGVRTRVDYVADANGFRPKITQEVLDLLSDDVPKPETEKDEKYGLKGYEFKWLYYPVETKTR